jgi:hypothetical protein
MEARPPQGWVSALLLLSSTAALAQSPPAALVPRNATGFSNIEQRYVYAPPDEGRLEIPLIPGLTSPNEVVIREPSMCRGSAKVTIEYSKSRGRVVLDATFRGLPYRMDFTRPADVSTPYNQFPVSVQDGKWQIWLVGRVFNFETLFYYDSTTLKLIGNEHDLPGGPPPNSFPVSVPVMHMTCMPLFEGTPGGFAHVRYEYPYNQIFDSVGRGGTYVAFLPFDLCKPDEYNVYYTKSLPLSMAMTWDQVLDNLHKGYSLSINLSLEPDPKPSYLDSRDNTMIGFGGVYPAVIPYGYDLEPGIGTLIPIDLNNCHSYVNGPWPTGYYNVCGG